MMQILFPALLDQVEILAQELLEIYGQDISAEKKSDNSPVTIADLHSHKRLIEFLTPLGFPILSEESKQEFDRSQTNRFWIVDPLDGTKDFLQKTGEFSIMIGFVENGSPTFGLVCVPALEKLYYAQKGQGAFLRQQGKETKLEVSQTREMKNANFVTSRNHFAPSMRKLTDQYGLNLVKCGSNGVKIGLIAEGKADLFFNPTDRMGIWDICGPQIILEEAGGMVTDCMGEAIQYTAEHKNLPFGIAASNYVLHDQTTSFTRLIDNSHDSR